MLVLAFSVTGIVEQCTYSALPGTDDVRCSGTSDCLAIDEGAFNECASTGVGSTAIKYSCEGSTVVANYHATVNCSDDAISVECDTALTGGISYTCTQSDGCVYGTNYVGSCPAGFTQRASHQFDGISDTDFDCFASWTNEAK